MHRFGASLIRRTHYHCCIRDGLLRRLRRFVARVLNVGYVRAGCPTMADRFWPDFDHSMCRIWSTPESPYTGTEGYQSLASVSDPSDLHVLGDLKGVIHLHAKIAQR